jgi:hypothetical protein
LIGRSPLGCAGLAAAVVACAGCLPSPNVSSAEVDEILTKSAVAVKPELEKRHATYCTDPAIAARASERTAIERSDGIVSLSKNDPFKLAGVKLSSAKARILAVQTPSYLPQSALAVLAPLKGQQCQSKLTLHQPLFVELTEHGQTRLLAVVDFDIRQPASCESMCFGWGLGVTFQRTAKGWVIEPPGVQDTWIS